MTFYLQDAKQSLLFLSLQNRKIYDLRNTENTDRRTDPRKSKNITSNVQYTELSLEIIPYFVLMEANKPGRVIRCVSQAEIVVFGDFSFMLTDGHTDGRTDTRTYGRTDRPSYRDARTHLKKNIEPIR